MPSATLRKCFELAGVVPLGVFLLVHVMTYSGVLFGSESFGLSDPRAPVTLALELLLVWAPLAFHAAYGLKLSLSPAGAAEAEEGRRATVWLRVTGACSLAFVIAHGVWLRLPLSSGERAPEDVAQMLAARLSGTFQGLPLSAAFHLLGLGAACLHLFIALPRFFKKWGVMASVSGRRLFSALIWVVFGLGAASIVELATGSAIPRFLSR